MNSKIVYGEITVAIVIAIVGCFLPVLPHGKTVFGSVDTTCQGFTTCFGDLYVTTASGGSGAIRAAGTLIADGAATLSTSLKVSSTGDVVARLNEGTCKIKPYATTIAGTTTATVDCASATLAGLVALTGVTFNDNVVATLSTTTSSAGVQGALFITGASASTTNGYITLSLYNGTGGTYTWSTVTNASGTASYIVTK